MLTDKQKAERRLGIGGSDVAAIFGLSSYKTRYQLYLEKLGLLDTDSNTNELMYWGNRLESIIIDEFEKRNNVEVETPDTVIHPCFDFMRANLDGYIPATNHVLEIKCANYHAMKQWGEPGSDNIPLPYLLQVAHYVACTNAKGAVIAVLVGGNEYREYYYKRNYDLENDMIEEISAFWDCVMSKTEPPAVSMVDITLKFPMHIRFKEVIAQQEHFNAIEQYNHAKREIKALKELQEEAKFVIASHMKDAEMLVDIDSNVLATYKTNKAGNRTMSIKENKHD